MKILREANRKVNILNKIVCDWCEKEAVNENWGYGAFDVNRTYILKEKLGILFQKVVELIF